MKKVTSIVVVSGHPDETVPLLEQLSDAVHRGHKCRVTLVTQGTGVQERQLLREQGWRHQLGTLTEAQVLAGDGLLLHPTDALPEAMQPPPKKTRKALPEAAPVPPSPEVPRHLVQNEDLIGDRPPTRWHIPVGFRAAFLVATHRRPQLLEACLRHLTMQEVPEGWQLEILVAGEASDPAARIVRSFPDTRFKVVPSSKVTDKLNHLAQVTEADLLLMADDDDLQSPNRLSAAVQAYTGGFDWSASGLHRFVNLKTGQLARWEGAASTGHVGTTVSIRRDLFLRVGGYPSVAQDKDGHLTHRIKAASPNSRVKDLSKEIGATTICLQHDTNIQRGRPFPAKGSIQLRGKFQVRGEGLWTEGDLSSTVLDTIARLRPKPEVPATRELPRAVAPPAGIAPITCVSGGPGQQALSHGLQALGFQVASLTQAVGALQAGRKVLFHGWGPQYAALGRKHPGQVFTLWHSGWTGSDLLDEGFVLAEALKTAQQGHVTLLWLDDRDVSPTGAVPIKPVWSPQDLASWGPSKAKVPRRVVVGFHSPYPAAAKNSLAAVVGCTGLGADLHLAQGVTEGPRGAAVQVLLAGEKHTFHPFLPRPQAVQLLGSAQVLVHTSLSDTWPYLVMEAIYVGTPVVLSDAIAWAGALPQWAQDLCLVRPAISSQGIRQKVSWLLDHPQDARRLVEAQREVLDRLAPVHAEITRQVLHRLGFEVPQLPPPPKEPPVPSPKVRVRPKVLLLSDVRGWAFDVNLRDMAEYLKDEFEFDFWYSGETQPWPDMKPYNGVYVPYHRWSNVNPHLPYDKALGSLRSWWFIAENPSPPTQEHIDMVNRYCGFHVVTQFNFDELRDRCPNLEYLTNPVNMRRFDQPTAKQDTVVLSWNGNARHHHAKGVDIKGYWTLVRPLVEQTRMQIEVAEYNTQRLVQSAMPAFYQKANLALCTSVYEGASNSVMEAMAAGQALVSTDVGNIREMRDAQMRHFGDTGIIIVDRSIEAFQEAVEALRSNVGRIVEMGRINRAEIAARWSWAVWRDRYAEFLRRVL